MYRTDRMTLAVTMIAVLVHGALPTLATDGAAIEGTVEVPCDPSRVGDVASVQIRPNSGGPATTVPVDPSSGKFVASGFTEGEYELIAIGADGEPLSPEPKKLVLGPGSNTVVLSMQPPGCGEPDSDLDGVPDAADSCPGSPPGAAVGPDGCPLPEKKKRGRLKDWHLTLIYVGVVGAVILALDNDDEDEASPF